MFGGYIVVFSVFGGSVWGRQCKLCDHTVNYVGIFRRLAYNKETTGHYRNKDARAVTN